MNSRSDWSFIELDQDGRRLVVLVDLNLGGRSVTNDLENVVRDLWQKLLIHPATTLIYRDSQGQFDQILFDNERYTELVNLGGTHKLAEAAERVGFDMLKVNPVRGRMSMDEYGML